MTAEEAARTPITDVVLPLPGTDVRMPENAVRDTFESLLAAFGITPDKFHHKVKYGRERESVCVWGGRKCFWDYRC